MDYYKYYVHAFKDLPYLLKNFFLTELILALVFILLIAIAIIKPKGNSITILFTLLSLIYIFIICSNHFDITYDKTRVIANSFYYDPISINFKFIIIISALLTVVSVCLDKAIENNFIAEKLSTIILSALGGCILVSSYNLLMFIVAIETISISIYLVCAFFHSSKTSLQGTYKYLLTNILLTLIFTYSLSILYGINKTIALDSALQYMFTTHSISSYFIFTSFIAIILFKLFIFPFNFFAPYIYRAASISGINFLSTIPKVALFGFLYRIIYFLYQYNNQIIYFALLTFACISLIFGAYCALKQVNIKSILGYGAVSDSGFLFCILVLSALQTGYVSAALISYYLLVYVIAISGICLVVSNISDRFKSYNITQYRGVLKNHSYLFICFVGFIISVVGMPPTAGFLAKLLLLLNVISAELKIYTYIFLGLFIIYSIITSFYYLRILSYMMKRACNLVSLIPEHAKAYREIICFILLIVIIVLLIYPFSTQFFQ